MTAPEAQWTVIESGVEVRTVAESAGSPVQETLTVATAREATGLTTVRVDGELDMLTAPTLISVVDDELDRGCSRLLVDLRPVRFLGSSGLSALIALARRCADQQVQLRLVADGPSVLRPLEITGLVTAFTTVSDPLDAW
ncbi:STAS domain-containing protein [Cryptosporangium aurantiacum]|uniref:Anti-sigma factor antagonist n=1 Tax=Cryptosporangium aurantiacum TaxID=134849 RepID=A0A1M7RP79_9ACTN|nr:STAS domain-containing protein [Cryptosporangium aurantiacum]SHN48029.1 anti-anti-sigma factor [Cryptosporangium aurantiacum]